MNIVVFNGILCTTGPQKSQILYKSEGRKGVKGV